MTTANWTKETTSTTGAGDLTLVPVSGYPSIADQFVGGEAFNYTLMDVNNLPIETGVGSRVAPNMMSRDIVLEKYVSGVHTKGPTAPVVLSGVTTVICTITASSFAKSLPGVVDSGVANNKVHVPLNYTDLANSGILASSSNRLFYWPVEIGCSGPFNGFALRATSGTNVLVDAGLYSYGTDNRPGVKIVESLNNSFSSGANFANFPSQLIKPGWYFMALNMATALSFYYGSIAKGSPLGVYVAEFHDPYGVLLQSGYAQGSLPAVATSGSVSAFDNVTRSRVPIVALRAS